MFLEGGAAPPWGVMRLARGVFVLFCKGVFSCPLNFKNEENINLKVLEKIRNRNLLLMIDFQIKNERDDCFYWAKYGQKGCFSKKVQEPLIHSIIWKDEFNPSK